MIPTNPGERPDNPPGHYVLAIDLGSGGLKAALVGDDGRVAASESKKVSTIFLPGNGAEQDPKEWWEHAKTTAKDVVRQSGISPEDIVAVSCDSQWSVVTPVDENGKPLMNAVHWLDNRGAPYNQQIMKGFPSVQGYGALKLAKWIRLAGLAPTHSGADSLGHVLYIKNERPDIYARTHKFLEPMDYLTARLTGRITATQKTMAPFMVSENRKWGVMEYNDALLRLAGLSKDKFPELIPNDGIVGPLTPSVADDLGLLPGTRVISGIGDSNASAIGSGALENFEPIIYIGTSLYMTAHVPFKKTDIAHIITSIPSPFPATYYLFGEQGSGGICVEFFLNHLIYPEDEFDTGLRPNNSIDTYERFNTAASRAPAGSDGVIFLPWLNGSVVPCEHPEARGGFMNMSLSTTRSHLSRAVMEGLAYNNRWTMSPAEKFMGRPIDHFRFSGGGALSDLWCQIHADVLGVPIHQVDDPVNATARGAAFLAFILLGHRTTAEVRELVKIRRVFTPDESKKELYDKMYQQYRKLFSKNKSIFTALNKKTG